MTLYIVAGERMVTESYVALYDDMLASTTAMGHVGYMAGHKNSLHPTALTAIYSRIQFYRLWKCWAKCEEGIEWHCTAEWFFLRVMYTKHNNIAESMLANVYTYFPNIRINLCSTLFFLFYNTHSYKNLLKSTHAEMNY